jgi:hypothetical protein
MVKTGHDDATDFSGSAVEDRFGTGGQYKHFKEAVKQLRSREWLSTFKKRKIVMGLKENRKQQLLPVLICDELFLSFRTDT